MTSKSFLLGAALLAASCGNYSNEDLEFMNAVPAHDDISATMPPSNLVPADEAELSKKTHDVITTFNGLLDLLKGVDTIRTYPPTSRIPNGRIWGPYPMSDHPLWLARFTITRDPQMPESFKYWLDVEPRGAGDAGWIPFVDGTFLASGGGVRQGVGTFHIQADGVRVANFGIERDANGNLFRELTVMYSTAAFPINVMMTMAISPTTDLTNTLNIDYTYEAQEDGRAGMEFAATDSASGAAIDVKSRWLATGRGRADASATDGVFSGTRTECWNDAFMETYNNSPFDPATNGGDASLCPDISTF